MILILTNAQAEVFAHQAYQIAAWDALIIENSTKVCKWLFLMPNLYKIININNAVKDVHQAQSDLDQKLELLGVKYKDLDNLLLSLEAEVDKLEKAAGPQTPADAEREQG